MLHAGEFDKLPQVKSGLSRDKYALNRMHLKKRTFASPLTACLAALFCCLLLQSGCISTSVWNWGDNGPPREEELVRLAAESPKIENPMTIPVRDRDFLWSILVDTVEDYFPIQSEERIQLVGNTLTEGYLKTAPNDAATMFEPWRKDNVAGFDQLHATLQTIQRHAEVYVRPNRDGFRIEIIVHKLLEDLPRPEYSTIGGATLRHSASHTRPQQANGNKQTRLGWIPQGRDVALEQAMLQDLQQRMAEATMPSASPPAANNENSTLGLPDLGLPDLGLPDLGL